ncbi:helix-turn-helix domain-containing protein [Streptacidiphilus anmyonensis]|uniref:helix-turn-helix domain-containing protein n=1 Tax=Streptacidiphilus anmyonensis TaxID=405782 RepID=UPI0005AA56B0|nr:helix-turn-helix domain-containing protein [Streptacidiphilus anmyonensis]
MAEKRDLSRYESTIEQIKEAREQAIHHTRLARQFAAERRTLMQSLLDQGVSQSDIARELGVTRQAVQKMLAC